MHRQNEPLIIFLRDIWSLVFMNLQNMRPFYSLQLTMDLWRTGRNTQILSKVVFKNKIYSSNMNYVGPTYRFLKVIYLNQGILFAILTLFVTY